MGALDSHSNNSVKINRVKKDLPFATRYYNRPSVTSSTDSPSASNSYYKDMCDINNIIANHMATGTPIPTIDRAIYNLDANNNLVGEVYGTNTNFTDRYLSAKQNFMLLPSKLRARFNNDVATFANYLNTSSDEDIKKLMVQYGLIKEEVKPAVGNLQVSDTTLPVQESVSSDGKE